MLDIRFVCENADAVKAAFLKRSGSYDVDAAVALDAERRRLLGESEELKQRRNKVTAEIALLKREKKDGAALIDEMKTVGERIKALDAEIAAVLTKLSDAVLALPNIPQDDVPEGKSDADNKVLRSNLTPKQFAFAPKAHWDIGEKLGILDFPAAAKISGARFTVYRDLGARLERAVINLMLDTHTQHGYTEIFAPFMVNRDSMVGTGQLPKFEEDMFAVKDSNYYLIPTAEVSVTNLHRNEILDAARLPLSYCAYSACFRAEAGSAGRDTRGLIRQHQFNKVELVKFTRPEDSAAEHEKLTRDAERILQLLELPYRVSLLCTGDMGFCSSKTYDIEVWMPSYDRYVEISSCSNFVDFQARRASVKFRGEDGKTRFAHTLNGSGLAAGRTVAAILENYQNADGTVTVPNALRGYMGTDVIGVKL